MVFGSKMSFAPVFTLLFLAVGAAGLRTSHRPRFDLFGELVADDLGRHHGPRRAPIRNCAQSGSAAPGLLFLNAGGLGPKRLVSWLNTLGASRPAVVGLCELQGWSSEKLSRYACKAGYPHSAFFRAPSGFHIGAMSHRPIEVVGRYSEGFQRGVLHVRIGGVAYLLAHLHAQSDLAHHAEVKLLTKKLNAVKEPVLLAGDLNMPSPVDASVYKSEKLFTAIVQGDMKILKAKYLSQPDEKKIDYDPMRTLLSTGLADMCMRPAPADNAVHPPSASAAPKRNATARKRRDSCWPTEPTSIPSDQVPEDESLPPTRLIYILADTTATKGCEGVEATAWRAGETPTLFDHYPVLLQLQSGGGKGCALSNNITDVQPS